MARPQQPSWVLKSKRGIGLIITAASQLLPIVAPLFGVEITADQINTTGEAIVNAVEAIGTALGLVIATWGSVAARGPMTLTRQA